MWTDDTNCTIKRSNETINLQRYIAYSYETAEDKGKGQRNVEKDAFSISIVGKGDIRETRERMK